MESGWRDALQDALALVLPVSCVGCGVDDRALCGQCREQLRPEPIRRMLAEGLAVWSGLAYEGVARSAMLAAKEHGRTGLLRDVAPALAAAASAALAGRDAADVVVVTIPTSPGSLRRRGFDPVLRLARRAGLDPRPLIATWGGAVQKALDVDARVRNRMGAFAASEAVRGRPVLLVDDVVTTGATLLAAAAAVRATGGIVLAAATVASTPRRHGRPSTIPADALHPDP